MKTVMINPNCSVYVFVINFETLIQKWYVDWKIKLSEGTKKNINIIRSKIIESLQATLFLLLMEYEPLFGQETFWDFKKIRKISMGHIFLMDSPTKYLSDMTLILLTQVFWEETRLSKTSVESLSLAKNFRIKTVAADELRIIDRFSTLDKEFCFINGKWDKQISRIMSALNPLYKLLVFRDYQTDLRVAKTGDQAGSSGTGKRSEFLGLGISMGEGKGDSMGVGISMGFEDSGLGEGQGKFSKKEISNFVKLNSPEKNKSAEGSVDNDKVSFRSYKSDLKSHKRAKS
jgi:hypothetical protein